MKMVRASTAVLAQALHFRRNMGNLWLTWVLLGLSVGMPALVLAWSGQVRLAALLAGIPLFFLVLMWWTMFIHTATLLNAPGYGGMVPLQRRATMFAAGAALLVASVVPAACLSAGLGHVGALALCFALPLIGTGMLVGGRWSGLVLIGAPFVAGRFYGAIPPSWWEFGGSVPGILLGFALVTLLGWLAARAALPDGSERHWRNNAKREQLHLAMLEGRGPGQGSALARRLYAGALARACVEARPARLMMFVFGKESHWSTYIVLIGSLALAPLLTFAYLFASGSPHLKEAQEMALLSVPALPAYGSLVLAFALAKRIVASRAEQALLRVVPGVPQGRQFQAVLGNTLLSWSLRVWGTCLVYALVLLLVAAPTGTDLLHEALKCLVSLPMCAMLLRDYARLRDPAAYGDTAVVFLATACLPLCWLALRVWWPQLGIGVLEAAAVLLAVLLVLWRLRVVQHAPVAFPAGRLA